MWNVLDRSRMPPHLRKWGLEDIKRNQGCSPLLDVWSLRLWYECVLSRCKVDRQRAQCKFSKWVFLQLQQVLYHLCILMPCKSCFNTSHPQHPQAFRLWAWNWLWSAKSRSSPVVQPAQGTPAEPILQLGFSSQVQTSLPTPNLSHLAPDITQHDLTEVHTHHLQNVAHYLVNGCVWTKLLWPELSKFDVPNSRMLILELRRHHGWWTLWRQMCYAGCAWLIRLHSYTAFLFITQQNSCQNWTCQLPTGPSCWAHTRFGILNGKMMPLFHLLSKCWV